jgi:hypothetical protein
VCEETEAELHCRWSWAVHVDGAGVAEEWMSNTGAVSEEVDLASILCRGLNKLWNPEAEQLRPEAPSRLKTLAPPRMCALSHYFPPGRPSSPPPRNSSRSSTFPHVRSIDCVLVTTKKISTHEISIPADRSWTSTWWKQRILKSRVSDRGSCTKMTSPVFASKCTAS